MNARSGVEEMLHQNEARKCFAVGESVAMGAEEARGMVMVEEGLGTATTQATASTRVLAVGLALASSVLVAYVVQVEAGA